MDGERPPDADKRETLRQFAAFGAIAPFTSLVEVTDDESATSDRRNAIRAYVSATPGVHFSKLRDDLGFGTGETQYHVRRLVGDGDLESVKDGDYRRLFPAGRFGAFERRALGYLRRSTPRRMILRLLVDPERSPGALADEIGVTPGAVSSAARELESVGLLSRESGTYSLERPEVLLTVLVRYADSFDRETVAFADRAAAYLRWDPNIED